MAIYLKYIGKKPRYVDAMYGTGIIWLGAGDIAPVDNQTGAKMLQHTDVYEPATKADYDALNGVVLQTLGQPSVEPEQPAGLVSRTKEVDNERDSRTVNVNVSRMNAVQLREHAMREYGKDIPKDMPFAEARKLVTELRKHAGIVGNT